MVDDMKKLVEKYKRELMEYSKSSVPEKPSPLTFPEMIKEPEAKPQPVKANENTPDESSSKVTGGGNYKVLTEKEYSVLREKGEDITDNNNAQEPPVTVPTAAEISDNVPEKTAPATDLVRENTKEHSEENVSVYDIPEMRGRENEDKKLSSENQTYGIPEFREPTPEIINHTGSGSVQSPDNSYTVSGAAVGNVAPENTQRLSDPPVSGLDPEEQLGRRNFEKEQRTVNSRSDIKPLVQKENSSREIKEPNYSSIEDFNQNNTRRGSLRFRVYTARGALPVPNASIEVTKNIGGKTHTFYKLKTDISGASPTVYLPAPYAELSQNPENTIQPYSLYEAFINASGYEDVYINNIPIFEGIQSEQKVAMVPGQTGKNPDRVNESEPDLNGGT